jgi:hypothetical protein
MERESAVTAQSLIRAYAFHVARLRFARMVRRRKASAALPTLRMIYVSRVVAAFVAIFAAQTCKKYRRLRLMTGPN